MGKIDDTANTICTLKESKNLKNFIKAILNTRYGYEWQNNNFTYSIQCFLKQRPLLLAQLFIANYPDLPTKTKKELITHIEKAEVARKI